MSTEEPAWKAELEKELAHVLRVGVIDIRARVTARDAVLPFLFEVVQAAAERGRREGLREAAQKIRQDSLCTKPYHRDYFADLINPDKEKA